MSLTIPPGILWLPLVSPCLLIWTSHYSLVSSISIGHCPPIVIIELVGCFTQVIQNCCWRYHKWLLGVGVRGVTFTFMPTKCKLCKFFFLMPDNKLRHFQFTKYIFSKVKAGENDLWRCNFNNEATIHVSGRVSHRNCRSSKLTPHSINQ